MTDSVRVGGGATALHANARVTAIVLLALAAACPAQAASDLINLLSQPEAEARRVLTSIELAPPVTGGIRELTLPSSSSLCPAKQLSTVDADVVVVDGRVTRVQDRRNRRTLGDKQAAFAFVRAVEAKTGARAQVAEDGENVRIPTAPDVVALFRIVNVGGAFTIVSMGAEIVNAEAKCAARKAEAAKEQHATNAAATRLRCEGGEARVCAEAAGLADDTLVAIALARRGCDGGDVDACSQLVRVVTRKGVAVKPEVCGQIFAARAKSCRDAPSRDLCDVRVFVRGCAEIKESPEQERDRAFGMCVALGRTRNDCEGEERDRATAVSASRGDEVTLGMPLAAFTATAVGITIPKKPYTQEKNACGTASTYRTPSGIVQYVFIDGKLAEVRRFNSVDVGPHLADDEANRRSLAVHMKSMCGLASVRESLLDSDDGGLELTCTTGKSIGRGAAIQVHDDGKRRILVQVADFEFEPALAARRAKCFPPSKGSDDELP